MAGLLGMLVVLLATVSLVRADDWHHDPEVSWYGPGFYGNRTACGLALTKGLVGVAHRSLPCGTLVEFRWQGRVVRTPVVDRGPYVAGRTWDLTGGACVALDHCFTGPMEWRFVGGSGTPEVTLPPTDVSPAPSARPGMLAL